jgi:hypothetical protein
VEKIYDYSLFLKINEDKQIQENNLSKLFWKKNDDSWDFDNKTRLKLISKAKKFYKEFSEILEDRSIRDIQISGPFTTFFPTKNSDIDVHIVLDLSNLSSDPKKLNSAIKSIKFLWNISNDFSIKGVPVDFFITDINKVHDNSPLYSLTKNKWIVKPDDENEMDQRDIDRKFDDISSEIEEMYNKLTSKSYFPSNSKELYKRCLSIKNKIYKMKRDSVLDKDESSINHHIFRKLKKSGYIDKLIDTLTKSYSKIYNKKQ